MSLIADPSILEKLEALLSPLNDALAWVDRGGIVQWCNLWFPRLVGKDYLQILDNPLTGILPLAREGRLLPPETHPAILVFKNKEKVTGTYEFQRANRKLLLEISGTLIQIGGRQEGAVLAIRDITVRRQVEEKMSWLGSFPELNPNPLIESDSAGGITYLNRAAMEIFPDLLTLRAKHPLLDQIGLVMNRLGSEGKEFTIREVPLNGRFYEEHISLVPGYRRVRIYVTDATERKQAEAVLKASHGQLEQRVAERTAELKEAYAKLKTTQDELIQTEKLAALGRFSSGVAHEVKNPLGILLGGIEHLERKLSGADSETKSALEKMKESTLRADRILKGLLQFARPSEMKMERVTPQALVEETLELLKYRASLANITIRTQWADRPLYVEADRNQIEQALFNLLINAVEAMPKGGVLRIKTAVEELSKERGPAGKGDSSGKGGSSGKGAPSGKGHPSGEGSPSGLEDGSRACVLEIADTGEGIPEEFIPRLFEPFFTTKRDRKGTGLGLSITRMIVERHRGTLTIESQRGKGTTARILLPLA